MYVLPLDGKDDAVAMLLTGLAFNITDLGSAVSIPKSCLRAQKNSNQKFCTRCVLKDLDSTSDRSRTKLDTLCLGTEVSKECRD